MCMSVYHRPIKQWCIVLWSDHPFDTIESKHGIQTRERTVRSQEFALEEHYCSLVVHLLVFFFFILASNDAHPACVVIISILCTV